VARRAAASSSRPLQLLQGFVSIVSGCRPPLFSISISLSSLRAHFLKHSSLTLARLRRPTSLLAERARLVRHMHHAILA